MPNRMSTRKAMVVCSQALMAEIVASTLREGGMGDVLIMRDALTACDRAVDWSPDVIIIDAALPYLGGLDFIAAIRSKQVPIKSNVPIVLLTSHISADCRRAATWFQVYELVQKPVCKSDLMQHVVSALLTSQEQLDLYIDPKLVQEKLQDARTAKQRDEAAPQVVMSKYELKQTFDLMFDDKPKPDVEPIKVEGSQLVVGDVINQDVLAKDGRLLARKGDRVTQRMLTKLIVLYEPALVHNNEILPDMTAAARAQVFRSLPEQVA